MSQDSGLVDKRFPGAWRDDVAGQVRWSRSMEQKDYMLAYRDASEYLEIAYGLEHFFKYLQDHKEQLGSSLVLDVGAGFTKGTSQLSASPFGQGLSFMATILQQRPEVADNLGKDRVLITPVESLRGIEDSSVAGVISIQAMAYSAAPEQAIQRIDEVLVAGGIIKATFQHEAYYNDKLKMGPHTRFTHELKIRGYDVAVRANEDQELEIVLAVKKGGFSTADELMQSDQDTWKKQVELIKKYFPE